MKLKHLDKKSMDYRSPAFLLRMVSNSADTLHLLKSNVSAKTL